MTTLSGLDHIEAGSISDLFIRNNDELLLCEVQSVCSLLANPNGNIVIENNASGCNSQEEVEDACVFVGLMEADNYTSHPGVELRPNPFKSDLGIILYDHGDKIARLEIYQSDGRKLIEKNVLANKESQLYIDASGWPVGVMYLRLTTGNEVLVKKIIHINN